MSGLELKLDDLMISVEELDAWILERFGEHERHVNRAAFLAMCEVQLIKTLNGVVEAIESQDTSPASSPGPLYSVGFTSGVAAVKAWIEQSLKKDGDDDAA